MTPPQAIDCRPVVSTVVVIRELTSGVMIMDETYCVLYRNNPSGRLASRLSMAYTSLDLAINAAFLIAEKQLEPIEIRGSDGTVMKAPELMKAIAICAG